MSKMIKLILISVFSLASSSAFAATVAVDDTFGITGIYSATGGTDLSDATLLQLSSLTATSASGDFATTISFPPPTGAAGNSANLAAFTDVSNFFTIAGWQLDLTSLSISDQTASLLTLAGAGVISGNGFDATIVNWTFSGDDAYTNSMTITSTGIAAVPVPAAVWLFGSGLLGLVGIARRKA